METGLLTRLSKALVVYYLIETISQDYSFTSCVGPIFGVSIPSVKSYEPQRASNGVSHSVFQIGIVMWRIRNAEQKFGIAT